MTNCNCMWEIVLSTTIWLSSEFDLSAGSICLRNGYLFIYTDLKDVEILSGENELKVYSP